MGSLGTMNDLFNKPRTETEDRVRSRVASSSSSTGYDIPAALSHSSRHTRTPLSFLSIVTCLAT